MKSKIPLSLLSALAALLLCGCISLTPPASAAESHGVALGAKSSAKIHVYEPRLQMNNGRLELAGSVAKAPGASSTAFSHLDVFFRDAAGRTLQEKPISFAPQSVGHSRFFSRLGYYSLRLEPLPEGTARIEVQAHDADRFTCHG
ncbi:MAG TPA: hypothetical protein VHD61_02330 [Lacunisphaera sp.]|nr:hypothetical protein [Lacunisphaera sp.]